jgi:hypothetical protein
MAKEKPIIQKIKNSKWKSIGHTLRIERERDKFSIGTLMDDVRQEDLRGHGGER